MKKQTLCFQKLLCFHYKYNLIFLDILCIILAIISTCIFFEYSTVVPRQDLFELCESALYEYIENPVDYVPADNVVISLEKNNIIASFSKSFFEITAYKNPDGTYQLMKAIQLEKFFISCVIFPLFSLTLDFIFFEFVMYFVFIIIRKISGILKNFKTIFRINLSKLIHTIDRKVKSKGYKEYEDSRLKEIYQIGYNMGYATGLSEGSKNNFDPMA